MQDEGAMRDWLPPAENAELPTVAIATADRAALCSCFNTELNTTATRMLSHCNKFGATGHR